MYSEEIRKVGDFLVSDSFNRGLEIHILTYVLDLERPQLNSIIILFSQHCYILFQIIKDADVAEVANEMSRYTYKSEGPFWAARFLPWSPKHAEYVTKTSAVGGEMPEEHEEKGRHVSHVVFSLHHGITDGYSTHRIMGHFLRLLNAHLDGSPLRNSQLDKFIDCQEEEAVKAEVEKAYRANESLLKDRCEILYGEMEKTLIEKVYPVAAGLPERTESLVHVVDKGTTSQFRRRCKEEGVTFTAAFSAVVHGAIMKLISDHVSGESAKILSTQTINCRRYFKNNATALGCGMNLFATTVDTPRTILTDFWPFARRFNKEMKYLIETKACYDTEVLPTITGQNCSLLELVNHLTGSPLPPLSYFATANMLDVTHELGDVGQHVRLQFYDRLTSIHKFQECWTSAFQTLRGELLHSMQYNHHLLDDEAAKKLNQSIFEIFAHVATS